MWRPDRFSRFDVLLDTNGQTNIQPDKQRYIDYNYLTSLAINKKRSRLKTNCPQGEPGYCKDGVAEPGEDQGWGFCQPVCGM